MNDAPNERREIDVLLQQGESLTTEFKSDQKCLPDKDLVSAVVALANTQGGDLLLGVEDNGTPTGLHPNHLDVRGIIPLIANRTIPSITVRIEPYDFPQGSIVRIRVPKSPSLVMTSDGLVVRRRLKLDGSPEAVPMPPHEIMQRQSSMGLVDPSALVLEDISENELDPLQRQRIRKAIKIYGGESSLLELSDPELDGALGLTREVNGVRKPTLTGLLLLGTEPLLRTRLPSHEVAFQVLQGSDIKTNEFFHMPILEVVEKVDILFRSFIREEEIQVGLFRVSIPTYDPRAFREAFINALVHRDYYRLGPVCVRLTDEHLTIHNPGGFVEGVTLQNLLVVDPRPRNPLLADVLKRIGLAERTGRGIDRIFEGLLRYGRPAPDYSLSTDTSVSVQMANATADVDFLKRIIEHEEKHGPMPIDTLILLSRLREERLLSVHALATSVQKSESSVHSSLRKLIEAGFVEAHGAPTSQTYTLHASFYQNAGKKAEYTRLVGFSKIQHEQMILRYIAQHGSIKRSEAMDLCHLSRSQAYYLLTQLVEQEKIRRTGTQKHMVYTL